MFGFNRKEENKDPIVISVYDSYLQAGRELASMRRISNQTQKKANQPMVRIPFLARTMLKLGLGRGKIVEAHDKMMRTVIKRS